MELMNHEENRSLVPEEALSNRRRERRVESRCGVTFSGVDGRHFVMGDGQVTDLSDDGVGIHGDRFLKSGMELALFIDLPDSDDHLCIPGARVSWVNGRRFGVALRDLKRADQNRLRFFVWNQQRPQ